MKVSERLGKVWGFSEKCEIEFCKAYSGLRHISAYTALAGGSPLTGTALGGSSSGRGAGWCPAGVARCSQFFQCGPGQRASQRAIHGQQPPKNNAEKLLVRRPSGPVGPQKQIFVSGWRNSS